MATTQVLTKRLETVFNPRQSRVLAEVITDAYNDLVKTSDFNELKAIVKDLATAQERTEARMEELAAAQERTEARMEGLAAAQQRTEARMEGLAVAQESLTVAQRRTEANLAKLTRVVMDMSSELGTVTQNMGYSLENEAYRMLPAVLARDYGIHLRERLVRTEIDGVEINFFAHGEREGKAICLIGEVKLRLDERNKRLTTLQKQLERQVNAVQQQHPDCEIVQLIVTHFARPDILQKIREQGFLVVQSFEW